MSEMVDFESEDPDSIRENALNDLEVENNKKDIQVISDFLTYAPEDKNFIFGIFRYRRRDAGGTRGPRMRYMILEMEAESKDEIPRLSEIQEQYGGGEYQLYIKVPTKSGKYKTFTKKIAIEGEPKIASSKEDMANGHRDLNYNQPGMISPMDMGNAMEKGRQHAFNDLAMMKQIFGNGNNGGGSEMLMAMMQMMNQNNQMQMQQSQQMMQLMMTSMQQNANMMMGTMGKVVDIKANNNNGAGAEKLLDTYQKGLELGNELGGKDEDNDLMSTIGRGLGALMGGFVGSKSGGSSTPSSESDEREVEHQSDALKDALRIVGETKEAVTPDGPVESDDSFIEDNIEQNNQADDIVRSTLAKDVSESEGQQVPNFTDGYPDDDLNGGF